MNILLACIIAVAFLLGIWFSSVALTLLVEHLFGIGK
jgi:hypothetical protein